MKKLIYLSKLMFLFCFFLSYGQENAQNETIGKIYVINAKSGSSYNHIYFPKPNFIIKRGGFANYDALIGKKIIVTKVLKEKKTGTLVSIKLEDGNKFFGVYPSIDANLQKAIEKGELLEVN
jgi:hypothetical protein